MAVGWGRILTDAAGMAPTSSTHALSRPDGSERLPLGDVDVHPFATLDWSPDGRFIAFTSDRQRAFVAG